MSEGEDEGCREIHGSSGYYVCSENFESLEQKLSLIINFGLITAHIST